MVKLTVNSLESGPLENVATPVFRQLRKVLYSELPLIWTLEMWPPLYSGHFEKSFTVNSL